MNFHLPLRRSNRNLEVGDLASATNSVYIGSYRYCYVLENLVTFELVFNRLQHGVL